MASYIVIVKNLITNTNKSIVCKNNSEVADLMDNLDISKYSVTRIEAIDEMVEKISDFCAKPKNLETGEKENV